MNERNRGRLSGVGLLAVAVAAPAVLTAILLQTGVHGLEYVFLYMGVVAAVAFLGGLVPSLAVARR